MKFTTPLATGTIFASKLFRPAINRPYNSAMPQDICLSLRLMLDQGVIDRGSGLGFFHLLPVGRLALRKLLNLIDSRMNEIGAQRLSMSSFCSKSLLDDSERWETMRDYLFTFEDKLTDSQMCLAPTHEELVTKVFNDKNLYGPADLPILLYQITRKFRNEQAPRFGLLRSREFLMKDLYSFHAKQSCLGEVYEAVSDAYRRLFDQDLNLVAYRVKATAGAMGGDLSHEFHLQNACGQDHILFCNRCQDGFNTDVVGSAASTSSSQSRQHSCGDTMELIKTIEIAHLFQLGTKYSQVAGAHFLSGTGRQTDREPFIMGCYGIGVTRLLAACVDAYSAHAAPDGQIRWPEKIAPFQLCIILPKRGSKEELAGAGQLAADLCHSIASHFFSSNELSDLLVDDRLDLTVGRRLRDSKALGCSLIIVVNKTALHQPYPEFELVDVNGGHSYVFTHAQLFDFLRSRLASQ